MKEKIWFRSVLAGTFLVLLCFAAYVITVDPFFHYHKPLANLAYPLNNERYQNDGIVKHFDYDAIITGTSLTANFKTSEFDSLFDVNAVKVTYHGGSFKEINDNLKRAVEANPDIRFIVRCLDMGNFTQDKDYVSYEGIPAYLYDKNPFNDTQYVLNKSVIISVNELVRDTMQGKRKDTFDEYMNWQKDYIGDFSRQKVLSSYARPEPGEWAKEPSEAERERIVSNIRQNVTDLARENPDITFYYFISPYNICYWDAEVVRPGKLDWYLEVERLAVEEVLSCDNIRLYSFAANYDLICDLDKYKDQIHFSEDINSRILEWMKADEYRLTKDNYEKYFREIRDFYGSYDYDSLYV